MIVHGWRWTYATGWVEADFEEIRVDIPKRNKGGSLICEDCQTGPSHYQGSADDMPLWRKGERKMYDGDSGDGVHTWAELIEIEDDLKHAYD